MDAIPRFPSFVPLNVSPPSLVVTPDRTDLATAERGEEGEEGGGGTENERV